MSSYIVKAIKPAVRRLATTYNISRAPYHGEYYLPQKYDLCDVIGDCFKGLMAVSFILLEAWSLVHLLVWACVGYGEVRLPFEAVLGYTSVLIVVAVAVFLLFASACNWVEKRVNRAKKDLAANQRWRDSVKAVHLFKRKVRNTLCVPVDLG